MELGARDLRPQVGVLLGLLNERGVHCVLRLRVAKVRGVVRGRAQDLQVLVFNACVVLLIHHSLLLW